MLCLQLACLLAACMKSALETSVPNERVDKMVIRHEKSEYGEAKDKCGCV